MGQYTIYDTNTGEIKRNVTCPDSMSGDQTISGEALLIELSNDITQYVDVGESPNIIVNKIAFPGVQDVVEIEADGVEEAIISSLPIPTNVIIDNMGYEVTDGSFEFSTEVAGSYLIKCNSFPYLDGEYTVNAS